MVDLAEARRVHAAAAEQLASLQDQMAQMDQQIEAIETDTQDLLVGLVPLCTWVGTVLLYTCDAPMDPVCLAGHLF